MKKTLPGKNENVHSGIMTAGCLVLAAAVMTYFSAAQFGNMPFSSQYYLYDFHMGFFSETLFGELAKLFTGVPMTKEGVASFCFTLGLAVALAFLVFFAVMLWKQTRSIQIRITVLFAFCFAVVNFYPLYFGYLYGWADIAWFIVFPLCCVFVRYEKLSWFLPFLTFFGIACHYSFSLLGLPAVLLLHLYEVWPRRKNRRRLVAFFLDVGFSAGWTVYFYFIKYFNHSLSLESFLAYLEKKAPGMMMTEYWIHFYENFIGSSGFADFWGRNLAAISGTQPDQSIITACLKTTLPLLAILSAVWIYSALRAEKKAGKLFYAAIALLPLPASALLFVTSDFGRWINAFLFMDFLVVLALASHKESTVREAVLEKKIPFGILTVCLIAAAVNSYFCGVSLF